jgi:hypothetical protein
VCRRHAPAKSNRAVENVLRNFMPELNLRISMLPLLQEKPRQLIARRAFECSL